MRILILGSGGREHALAWKISQSPVTTGLFIAPGNPGTGQCGQNIDIPVHDFEKIAQLIMDRQIDLLIVGPEQALVDGIRDDFENRLGLEHLLILGPGKHGAALEGSKDFAKAFMQRHGIPTAPYQSFTESSYQQGIDYLSSLQPPYVLKADGLAAGKGVIICEELDLACETLKDILVRKKFGPAGVKVVVEAFLHGIELSAFVISDGKDYRILPQAKDYKRIGEGDTGPNTGGMGTLSPVPFADQDFMHKVEERIILPTIQGLQKEGVDYRGFIFFGLMNVDGDPYVIEYNVRLGDPEAESILPRIQSDLVPVFIAAAQGNLGDMPLLLDQQTAVTLILASGGYPGAFHKGIRITGLDTLENSHIFHAGTQIDPKGNLATSGGRVIALTSLAPSLEQALSQVYADADRVSFEGKYYRRDLGQDILAYMSQKRMDNHKRSL